jgi:hypothetical protein
MTWFSCHANAHFILDLCFLVPNSLTLEVTHAINLFTTHVNKENYELHMQNRHTTSFFIQSGEVTLEIRISQAASVHADCLGNRCKIPRFGSPAKFCLQDRLGSVSISSYKEPDRLFVAAFKSQSATCA